MTRVILGVLVIFALVVSLQAGPADSDNGRKLQVFLSEVQPGVMATEQNCMLVFADHSFHAERTNRRNGKIQEQTVYEGNLAEGDWNNLVGILDNEQFRTIHVQRTAAPLVVEDAHAYTIAVARGKETQNMEFLDNESRKPYDAQLKPLFHWWKSMRGRHMTKSDGPPDTRCGLDDSHGVFAY